MRCLFAISFLLLCLNSNYYCINGAEVAQCNALNFDLTVSLNNSRIFAYWGNASVATADSFHSIISLINTKIWSSNSSIYYQSDVPYFNDVQYSSLECPAFNGSGCNLTVLDGYSFFELPTIFNGIQMDFGITQYLVIDHGTFIDDDGFSFDPISKSCMSFTESWPNPYIIKHNYCCTNYTYITIPENDPNPCTELKGTTMFVDTYDNIATLLTTTFGITASGLNVTLTTNMLQSPMTISKIFPNYVNYDCESSMKSSCNFMLKRGLARNSLYNMFMGGTTADDINNGYFPSVKIIKRNGMYLKNDNQLFTPNIPCSSVTTPFINGIKTLNTLCCSKFQESAKEMNTRKVFHSKKRNLLRIQPKPFKRSKSL